MGPSTSSSTAFVLAGVFVASSLWNPVQEAKAAMPPGGGIGEARVIATTTLPRDPAEGALAPLPEDAPIVDATLVGGLSGIDYDPRSDSWLVISDDPSVNSPARYYTFDLTYNQDSIDTLEFQAAITLLQANGEPYPDAEEGGNVPDLEAIRFDPESNALWYVSEGNAEAGIDPFVAVTEPDGPLIASMVPAMFEVSDGEERGPRGNMAFEGLTFAADGESLWVAMEGPLYQDGEPPTVDTTAFSRITNIDREGNVLRQVAYEIDRLPVTSAGSATIGVTEILAIDDDRLLVLQRAGIEKSTLFETWIEHYAKIYEIRLGDATDISGIAALDGATFQPVRKRLVLDLNAADVERVDNIEGMSWGPELENGHRSLVLVSDDNFNEDQVTQFIVLDVEAELTSCFHSLACPGGMTLPPATWRDTDDVWRTGWFWMKRPPNASRAGLRHPRRETRRYYRPVHRLPMRTCG